MSGEIFHHSFFLGSFVNSILHGNGIFIFALLFEHIEPIYQAAKGADRQTLPELTGLPTWFIVVSLFIMAVVGFIVGNKVEQKGDGIIQSSDLEND